MRPINHLNFKEESLVYPGVFIPWKTEPESYSRKKNPGDRRKKFSSTIVKELMDSYLVETSLPMMKREDFLVRAYGNHIDIDVRINATDNSDRDADQKRESKFLHFNRKVILPEDADTGFMSGEYSAGVLRLHVSKLTHPVTPRQSIIVIY
jgi:HSP20 family molecular chaperone IbpA